jgi:hypothetical protein
VPRSQIIAKYQHELNEQPDKTNRRRRRHRTNEKAKTVETTIPPNSPTKTIPPNSPMARDFEATHNIENETLALAKQRVFTHLKILVILSC